MKMIRLVMMGTMRPATSAGERRSGGLYVGSRRRTSRIHSLAHVPQEVEAFQKEMSTSILSSLESSILEVRLADERSAKTERDRGIVMEEPNLFHRLSPLQLALLGLSLGLLTLPVAFVGVNWALGREAEWADLLSAGSVFGFYALFMMSLILFLNATLGKEQEKSKALQEENERLQEEVEALRKEARRLQALHKEHGT